MPCRHRWCSRRGCSRVDACEDVSVADAGRHDNQATIWQTRFAELDRQFQEAMAQQHTSTTREKETQDLVHTLQARLANEEAKTGAVKQHNDALTQQLKRARADLEACMEATAAASEREAAAVEAARVSSQSLVAAEAALRKQHRSLSHSPSQQENDAAARPTIGIERMVHCMLCHVPGQLSVSSEHACACRGTTAQVRSHAMHKQYAQEMHANVLARPLALALVRVIQRTGVTTCISQQQQHNKRPGAKA